MINQKNLIIKSKSEQSYSILNWFIFRIKNYHVSKEIRIELPIVKNTHHSS